LQISKKRALKYCEDNGKMPYFEVSAKEGTGVAEAFLNLAAIALRQSQM
jgi:hypothetical protein